MSKLDTLLEDFDSCILGCGYDRLDEEDKRVIEQCYAKYYDNCNLKLNINENELRNLILQLSRLTALLIQNLDKG